MLTSAAYNNAVSGDAWVDREGGPGNGKLIMDVTGTLTVGASGRIHMDAKGYQGGTSSRSQGGSYAGPGIMSMAANGGGGGGSPTWVDTRGGGGSYGTTGGGSTHGVIPGEVFGADDFITKLYLGSGGGAGRLNANSGGSGGGAIKIVATNVSLGNGAQITARGQSSSTWGGSGSGGTIVMDISGTFTNSGGTISAAGGTTSIAGGDSRISFPQTKLVDNSNNLTVAGISPIDINLTSGINTFSVGANTTVNLTGADNVVVNSLAINGASAVVNVNSDWSTGGRSFGDVTVTNGTLTTRAYNNAISGDAWVDREGGAGNGKLIMRVTGTLSVATSGRINMDSKGYRGGTPSRSQGGSYAGPGIVSMAANGGGGGGSSTSTDVRGGGGSYGTLGGSHHFGVVPGEVFGADNFIDKLYLGSGGGAGRFNNEPGGLGGGAIKIVAANVSLGTGAQITARGQSSSGWGGSGSGGTIVMDISGTFTNSGGTISAAGGTTSIAGGDSRISFPQTKLVDNSNNLTVAGISPIDINLTSGINTFSVGANTTVNLTGADNVVVNSLAINGASAVVNVNSDWSTGGRSFGNVTVTTGTLTSRAYDNAVSGGAWVDTFGSAGNGKLIMRVTGTLNVAAAGRINMDGKGYQGGIPSRTQGSSHIGPGTSSSAANGGGGGGGGGGGSYGTSGNASGSIPAGTVYGASDFVDVLYLGAGGGAVANGPGGTGGGSMRITAVNVSLSSGAQITARGGNAVHSWAGAGAGGTIVMTVSGSYSNSGATISVTGGTSGAAGGAGRTQLP